MSTPPQFGEIFYSNDMSRLAKFYIDLFEMVLQRETEEFISLANRGFNKVIHTPPVELPPNSFRPMKIFLTVDSLAKAKKRAVKLGGDALPGEWSNPAFKVCNIADSDGNHLLIREFKKPVIERSE